MVAFWDMSNALQVADRVVFVGPQSGHVSKLREGELRKRLLFEFQTTYQAAEFMRLQTLPGELILLKGILLITWRGSRSHRSRRWYVGSKGAA